MDTETTRQSIDQMACILQAVVSSGKVRPKKRNLITRNFMVSEVKPKWSSVIPTCMLQYQCEELFTVGVNPKAESSSEQPELGTSYKDTLGELYQSHSVDQSAALGLRAAIRMSKKSKLFELNIHVK